jgi:preprotein translocase subunit SecE
VAEKNRRGEQPADDDNLDESFDENFDEAFDDAVDDDAEEPVSRSGGTATRTRRKAGAEDSPPKTRRAARPNVLSRLFAPLVRFVREVFAELRKVIWPTRKELLTYTAVVIVFVSVITAIVVGLDYVFAKGALFVFGDPE